MNRSNRRSTSPRRTIMTVCTLMAKLLVLAGVWSPAYSAPPTDASVRTGLSNSPSRPLSIGQLQKLLDGLRFITGLREMRFDDDGVLNPGDRTQITGGSATARALIFAAVDGVDAFMLENHDHSEAVAFAAIESIAIYRNSAGRQREAWRVMLDTRDFAQLRGAAEAIAAFSPAMNLLHELSHGVLGLSDAVSPPEMLGECERHINQIRRELGLPERQRYEARTRLSIASDNRTLYTLAELTFVQAGVGKRDKTFALSFNAEKISPAILAASPARRTEIQVAR